MTDALNEQLSALIDGELPAAESELVLKRLERNPELRATFSRYALIGEAMRSSGPVAAAPSSLLKRVADGLETPAAGPAPAGARAWWRPAAGMGVAAAVGAVAVLLVAQGTLAPRPATPVAAQVAVPAPAQPEPLLRVATEIPAKGASPSPGRSTEPKSYVTPPQVAASGEARRLGGEFVNYLVAHVEHTREVVPSALRGLGGIGGLVAGEEPVDVSGQTLDPATAQYLFGTPQRGLLPPGVPGSRDRP